jgi:hypothetical protein
MEAIILGNPFIEDLGTVTPIIVPSYEAEEAVIELTTGYNPYVIGGNGTTNIVVNKNSSITRLFTISNLIINSLNLGISEEINIISVNVNGIEYYNTIDYTISGNVISFIDYLPYDSTIGNTLVRVMYSLVSGDNVDSALTANMIPLDTTGFHSNLDNTITDVQKLADAVDILVGGGGGTETDPVFVASQAHNITSGHITILGNTSNTNSGDETVTTIKTKLGITTLSGSNTGDQNLSNYVVKGNEVYSLAISDEVTSLTTGVAKVTVHWPYTFTLISIFIGVTTAPTGSTLIVDVKNNAGTTIFSTKPSIDISGFTSLTASVPNVLSITSFTKGDKLTVNIDQVGATIPGTGLKIYFIGTKS